MKKVIPIALILLFMTNFCNIIKTIKNQISIWRSSSLHEMNEFKQKKEDEVEEEPIEFEVRTEKDNDKNNEENPDTVKPNTQRKKRCRRRKKNRLTQE